MKSLFVAIIITLLSLSTYADTFAVCTGRYALCAASTCTPTGKTITINTTDGQKKFPEAVCNCPVINGNFLADLTGGNMQGSCDRPSKGGTWSLFTPRLHLPQEMNDWKRDSESSRTVITKCDASMKLATQTVNCFSMKCDRPTIINGVAVSACYCPIAESVAGLIIKPETEFLIQSGQGNKDYCGKHPVAVTPIKN